MLRKAAQQFIVNSNKSVRTTTASLISHHQPTTTNNNAAFLMQPFFMNTSSSSSSSPLWQIQHQIRQLSITQHNKQQQSAAPMFQDADFTENEEVIESFVDDSMNTRRRRITASQLPKHNAKEMASYPSVTFEQRDLRQGFRKVNDVARMIRGLNAKEALYHLEFCGRKVGVPLAKFLKGCMTNCENFHGLNADRLLIKKAFVGRGKYLKRIRYHARMRHGIMTRKSTHFYITLVEVPYKENERRLGRYGWTNATWEKIYASNEKQREAMREQEEAAAAAANGDAAATTPEAEAETEPQQQQKEEKQ